MSSSKRSRLRRRQDRAKHLRLVGRDEVPTIEVRVGHLSEVISGGMPASEIAKMCQAVADLREEYESEVGPLPRAEAYTPKRHDAPRKPWWQAEWASAVVVTAAVLFAVVVATALVALGNALHLLHGW